MSAVAPAPVSTKRRVITGVVWLIVVSAIVRIGFVTQTSWLPYLLPATKPTAIEPDVEAELPKTMPVLLSAQAQANLKIKAKPLKAETYWKTITVPGMVIDRPGFSDRSVIAPVTGVISRIHRVAGDQIKPGDLLFTIKLLSESLHLTQTELFKATQDIKLAQSQRKLLIASAGAVSDARILEVDNQITRLEVAVKAYRQDLLNRELSPSQIDDVMQGKFISEMPIIARAKAANKDGVTDEQFTYEVQELKVELGQQVQAGQTLCLLANHQMLAIEGRAFSDEAPLLEQSLKNDWPVEIDFGEEHPHDWPTTKTEFRINYIANSIDPESRTFRFLMPLDNQSKETGQVAKHSAIWRYRPGQRVRVFVRVEKLDSVFILPKEAVAREGADAFIFRQNVDMFDRKPVRVLFQDRNHVVIANDGSVLPGVYVAQTGAAQLNRMVKAQSGAVPKGFHIHADGSVHMGGH